MSSFPNPHHSNDSSKSSAHSSQRSQPSAWAPQQPQQRRGLTPISTSFSSAARPSSSSQTPRNLWSPTASNPTPNPLPSSRQSGRSTSISSARSPFSPPPSSHQQALSNPQPRSVASSADHQLASNTTSASQGGGSGGSNSGGGSNSRLSRASPSISQSTFGSPTATSISTPQAAVQSGSLSKIVIAQLFLLLSTIKEDKDKAKWESQADQIRKLVDAHGMDVFTKYFRRLLLNNAPHIWQSGRPATDTSGNYQILVTEIQKVTQDPEQAAKIVESVDHGEGDIFKDFELSTFMEHFKMSPLAKITLATAFKRASKSDLRTKADATITSNLTNFFNSIWNQSAEQQEELSPAFLATILDRLAQYPPRNWSTELYHQLAFRVQQRYHSANLAVPLELSSTMYLFEIPPSSQPLISLVQKHGSKATESIESCKNMLDSAELREVDPQQVASALIFMVIACDDPPYNAQSFVTALREHRAGQRLDWQDVVRAFDRQHLKVTKAQFKALFDALMPLAKEYENFDIQRLWGGSWQYEDTQLSFNAAFLSFTEQELDASEIPKLRPSFTLEDFNEASDDVKKHVETAVKHPLVSLDAASALFDMVFRSTDTYAHAQSLGVVETAINRQMDLFVCAVSGIPKPWGGLQDQAMKQLIQTFFLKQTPGYEMVFYILWKRDKTWLQARFTQFYQQNPMCLPQIFEHAEEHGWLQDLIASLSELSLDLAAFAHGKNSFDLETWLGQTARAIPAPRLLIGLTQFLKNKAEDDVQSHRESVVPSTIPLQIKTVYTLLKFLGEASSNMTEDDLVQLQRACIQAYPRLINYGEGFDEVIDENSRDGNAISAEADARMQEHYKLMYSGDMQVRDIINTLQSYKNSQDSAEQDLFACMIFGLFDEYNCFGEYPLDALATTAVLFGGIINYNLLSRIALQAAVAMVLEAVRDYPPGESMYKFGLQALLHFQDRLEEWTRLSQRLLEVPGLRGTPIFPVIERVVQKQNNAPNGDSHEPDGGDGPLDDFLEPKSTKFTCLSVDPPQRQDFYRTPEERVQDDISFILNNVTEKNIAEKTEELKSKLNDEHYQWFANYVVDSRIKPQPNFRNLYMDILDRIGDQTLWAEVLRESYASAIHLLNAEATISAATERNNLKTLGVWLGAITLARDIPIRYKNISFRDLLTEAYDTQRLIVAIPFTCKVLASVAHSVIFKPPCSWTMEIVEILTELYYFGDIKLNLKFEIEVLCKDIGLDHKTVEPSDAIRNRPPLEEELIQQAAVLDGHEGFGDLSLMNISRRAAHDDRFSPSAMIPSPTELQALLKHGYTLPPTSGVYQSRIHALLNNAVERAVSEIIGPVVERSVTIAAISTAQLIKKDFATESDATRYEQSAHTTVRSLAGSLASVTCKEPLRASMHNNIRLLARDHPADALPEGAMLMFINDNLDNVCKIVESAAEEASIAEIDAHIENSVRERKNGTYSEPALNHWSKYIPDPFKPSPGGLKPEQMAIYEDFGQQARPRSTHANTSSQDSVRQLPDVLQDQLPSIANLANTADAPMLSRHMPQSHGGQPFNDLSQPPMNGGYTDTQSFSFPDLINEIYRSAKEAAAENPRRNLSAVPALREQYHRLLNIISASTNKVEVARGAIGDVAGLLFRDDRILAVTDLFAQILTNMIFHFPIAGQDLKQRLAAMDYDQICSPEATVALLSTGMLVIENVDLLLARAIHQRRPGSLAYLSRLVDHILLADPPIALRSEFSSSLSALGQWLQGNPEDQEGREIAQKLQDTTATGISPIVDPQFIKDAQNDYIFEEWVKLQYNETQGPPLVSFILQLHTKKMLTNQSDIASFLRACLNSSIAAFEQDDSPNSASSDAAYIKTDSLAKLIVMIVAYQGKQNGAVKPDKAGYFETMMTILSLVIAQHYQRRQLFNQKVFFRLFSSIICEVHQTARLLDEYHNEILLKIGIPLRMLQPQLFPGFAFAWTSILSHRLFMPALLKSSDYGGWDLYCLLLKQLLAYVGDLMKPLDIPLASKDLCRGTLKLLVVLYHDFPEFLADNHYELLSSLPLHCTQLRSLIISASPAYFSEMPDLFSEGIKATRLQEINKAPVIRGDIEAPLLEADILSAIDTYLRSSAQSEASMDAILRSLQSSFSKHQTGVGYAQLSVDPVLYDSLVLYVVKNHESTGKEQSFTADSPHGLLLESLFTKLHPEGRYNLLSAIANQLRYPNSHTQFFSHALLHLFKPGQFDASSLDMQQQITRVILERLMASRPHPWGLIITTVEILKNRQYRFWELPFVKASTDVERMFASLLQQMSQNQRIMS